MVDWTYAMYLAKHASIYPIIKHRQHAYDQIGLSYGPDECGPEINKLKLFLNYKQDIFIKHCCNVKELYLKTKSTHNTLNFRNYF